VPKLLHFRFPEGWYLLNFDDTELKISSKIIILFPNGIAGRQWVNLTKGGNFNLPTRYRFSKCNDVLKSQFYSHAYVRLERRESNLIHFKWGSVWIVTSILKWGQNSRGRTPPFKFTVDLHQWQPPSNHRLLWVQPSGTATQKRVPTPRRRMVLGRSVLSLRDTIAYVCDCGEPLS